MREGGLTPARSVSAISAASGESWLCSLSTQSYAGLALPWSPCRQGGRHSLWSQGAVGCGVAARYHRGYVLCLGFSSEHAALRGKVHMGSLRTNYSVWQCSWSQAIGQLWDKISGNSPDSKEQYQPPLPCQDEKAYAFLFCNLRRKIKIVVFIFNNSFRQNGWVVLQYWFMSCCKMQELFVIANFIDLDSKDFSTVMSCIVLFLSSPAIWIIDK